jgi:hypothetical protein
LTVVNRPADPAHPASRKPVHHPALLLLHLELVEARQELVPVNDVAVKLPAKVDQSFSEDSKIIN